MDMNTQIRLRLMCLRRRERPYTGTPSSFCLLACLCSSIGQSRSFHTRTTHYYVAQVLQDAVCQGDHALSSCCLARRGTGVTPAQLSRPREVVCAFQQPAGQQPASPVGPPPLQPQPEFAEKSNLVVLRLELEKQLQELRLEQKKQLQELRLKLLEGKVEILNSQAALKADLLAVKADLLAGQNSLKTELSSLAKSHSELAKSQIELAKSQVELKGDMRALRTWGIAGIVVLAALGVKELLPLVKVV